MPTFIAPTTSTVFLVISIVLAACVVVAWCLWIALMVDSAVAKGCTWDKGWLWFIGLFLTPLALGLAVIGMPDRRDLS